MDYKKHFCNILKKLADCAIDCNVKIKYSVKELPEQSELPPAALDSFLGHTKEELEKVALYTLRRIGRAVGVQSPTSKKKPELIEAIDAVRSGLKPPVNPDDRGRGRPHLI